ncbi:MAG TPA: DUF2085 domain-containing protein [Bacteroidota bacterium]
MRLSKLAYFVILFGSLLWCAGIFVVPLLTSAGGISRDFGTALLRFYSTICHQIDSRSFHLHGEPLAVCARCSSIYLGFLAGTMFFPLVRPGVLERISPRWLLLVAVFPMLIDVGLNLLGLHGATLETRSITGGFFGLIVPLLIIPSATAALTEMFSSPSSVHIQKG